VHIDPNLDLSSHVEESHIDPNLDLSSHAEESTCAEYKLVTLLDTSVGRVEKTVCHLITRAVLIMLFIFSSHEKCTAIQVNFGRLFVPCKQEHL
jgi:hypothetical protein